MAHRGNPQARRPGVLSCRHACALFRRTALTPHPARIPSICCGPTNGRTASKAPPRHHRERGPASGPAPPPPGTHLSHGHFRSSTEGFRSTSRRGTITRDLHAGTPRDDLWNPSAHGPHSTSPVTGLHGQSPLRPQASRQLTLGPTHGCHRPSWPVTFMIRQGRGRSPRGQVSGRAEERVDPARSSISGSVRVPVDAQNPRGPGGSFLYGLGFRPLPESCTPGVPPDSGRFEPSSRTSSARQARSPAFRGMRFRPCASRPCASGPMLPGTRTARLIQWCWCATA